MTATREPAADRELVITRDFDAPRALVFDAWTDARHLARWWGPNGFTTTTASIDVRPGGQWRFVMHGPDGRDYPNLITYLEILRPERIVYKHGGEAGLEDVSFQTTVTFAEVGGKTRVTLRMLFDTAAERDRVAREYGAEEGGRQTLARLAGYVAEVGGVIVSTRVIAAPRERVFGAFADPKQLTKWWGPAGFTSTFAEFDFRPGGAWRFVLHGPDGTDYPNASDFTDVTPPALVRYRHIDGVHGFTMTMTFDADGDRTRLTWQMAFDLPEEAARVRDFVLIANEQNFDRLAAHLGA